MKKLFLFLTISIFAACGKKLTSENETQSNQPSNVLENLTFQVDTIIVDSGKELFNLKDLSIFGKQNYFSLSQNNDSLYFFDRHRLILHEIDLKSLKLVNNFPFEQEGPDGIGRFVYTFKWLPNKQFYVKDLFGNSWFFSKEGRKLAQIEINSEEMVEGTRLESFSISNQQIIDFKRKKLYSLPRSFKSRELYFAVLESMGETGRILKIPELEKTFNFFVELKGSADGGGGKGEMVFLQQLNDLVLISSTVGNSIYVYDPNLDSLFFKAFPHELAPLGKNVEIKKEVFSDKEFQAELNKLHTQIDYWDFYWDEQTQRYYRFASKGLPLANIDSPKNFEYFLFAYDRNLTLKGEKKLEGFSELPLSGFFKDGKLWSYVNVDDELGFAVFTFDF
ncbi:MAG: hypothetical protein CL554_01950 [Algoriphagus sp.]|jgi:hypothetical protein|uniref:DUF4221 family protein n=3 Tax=Algoriphagus TaxID=246875 RepID=UPI000C603846|nr:MULTISPECIES: DUF4221 family protein [unclassified Algoriphagus]MAL12168.1 hypothetical protein [Algoriphagus sp.]QYH40440.1 DUF4221 domain-containing protein [Algoriphagus sp. NBT04N3]HAS59617.1 hypothetical protein [Algoriphagus sp.]|tara:strand:- start:575 stop:1750 length:1176 start_codon:yes stop_codon:yes gene_type:complete